MSALIIPCYIKTQWDIDCLNRLFDSVQASSQHIERFVRILSSFIGGGRRARFDNCGFFGGEKGEGRLNEIFCEWFN